jgi:hypothetical protein
VVRETENEIAPANDFPAFLIEKVVCDVMAGE